MAPRARPAYAPSSFVKPFAGPDEHAKIAATWTAKGGLTVIPVQPRLPEEVLVLPGTYEKHWESSSLVNNGDLEPKPPTSIETFQIQKPTVSMRNDVHVRS